MRSFFIGSNKFYKLQRQYLKTSLLNNFDNDVPKTTEISWYPGHIAKAERELADYLKKVDVVIEVRDARIPFATTHPMVPEWIGNKPLIVAIARLDQISKNALTEWKKYYTLHPAHHDRPDVKVYFIDGKLGAGVLSLKKQALKVGDVINEKRKRRGIQPRAVRAAVIGFPNVGKSALINRLLGRKLAKSRNLPGVTRKLQWVRIGGVDGSSQNHLELLDSPGIIPAKQISQGNALKLAICNDIGEASYDRVAVAIEMCNLLKDIYSHRKANVDMRRIEERYKFSFHDKTGEEIVYQLSESSYHGNLISASDKLLGDFRRGFLGSCSLENAPFILDSVDSFDFGDDEDNNENNNFTPNLDVGLGNYDGW
jgi:ribosome biogenesis GTPase A